MYANLQVPVAPAQLVEFSPAMPTWEIGKLVESFNDDLFEPKHISNFITLFIIELFILQEKMGEWPHQDALTQRGAGNMLPTCHYCIAVNEDVLFFANAQFSLFFCSDSSYARNSPCFRQNCDQVLLENITLGATKQPAQQTTSPE